jgi:hypothetical protein
LQIGEKRMRQQAKKLKEKNSDKQALLHIF